MTNELLPDGQRSSQNYISTNQRAPRSLLFLCDLLIASHASPVERRRVARESSTITFPTRAFTNRSATRSRPICHYRITSRHVALSFNAVEVIPSIYSVRDESSTAACPIFSDLPRMGKRHVAVSFFLADRSECPITIRGVANQEMTHCHSSDGSQPFADLPSRNNCIIQLFFEVWPFSFFHSLLYFGGLSIPWAMGRASESIIFLSSSLFLILHDYRPT